MTSPTSRSRHRVKHGQTDQPLITVFGHEILPAPIAKLSRVIRVQMHRNVMHVDANVFRAQRARNLGAILRQFRQIQANGIQVPRRIDPARTAGGITPGISRNAAV